jgi:hypothetical protein
VACPWKKLAIERSANRLNGKDRMKFKVELSEQWQCSTRIEDSDDENTDDF